MYFFAQADPIPSADTSTVSAPAVTPAPSTTPTEAPKPQLGIVGWPMIITAVVVYLWTRYR